MRTIKKILSTFTIGLIIAIFHQNLAAQTTVDGKVSKIGDKSITIETSMADNIPTGSKVELFFEVSDNQSIPIGEWKVSSASNGEVIAIPVDVLGPPQKGMVAKISFQEKKKPVQVIRQDHSNGPSVSKINEQQEANTKFESIEPQIRGKEPKGQLLGIPFPEKSINDYMDEGNRYYNEKNYKMAMKEYEQCARMGNSECQRMLGLFYNNGFGVEKDLNKARQFYEESALQNNRDAIYNLGVMYANGNGVKKDLIKARELFLKSANMGYPEAQFNLGAMYYNGMGVEKNAGTALKWFKKAADQNIPKAIYVVGQGHEFGWGIPKDLSRAKEYYQKAADLGYKDAIEKLKKR